MMITTSIAALGMMASSVMAQNLTFGADNFYRSANVTVTPIKFQTQYHYTISGNIFRLNTSNGTCSNASLPAIVVGHPMGATKEQAANLYATKMAEQGFVTVSLDLPFWGTSDGMHRNAVAPEHYAEAFSAAVDYLGTRSYVDRDRIGALGICGSGSFVISAAKIDSRIKAVATASMYDMGDVTRNGLNNGVTAEGRAQMIAIASEQRWNETDGGEIALTGGTTNEITPDTDAIQHEFYDFYRTIRGAFTAYGTTENMTTHPTLSTQVKFLNFYPFVGIGEISPRAMLFVTGTDAHSREFSEKAMAAAGEPKELVWILGANHVDLYDRTELIPFAKFTEFFTANL